MKNIFLTLFILAFTESTFSASSDFKGLSFLDKNLRIGVGMAYSKLESNSDLGNYYLLSQANPRLEVSFDTGVQELFRQRFAGYVFQEMFRPENDAYQVKSKTTQTSYGFSWQPMWVNEAETFSYGLKFAVKSGTVISEIPTLTVANGDVAARYSAEGGASFVWYGQTVSKFPLCLNLELLYSQGLFDNSALTYYNGYIYRFAFEFDFKKKSLFAGWNLKGFYEYEDIANSYTHTVDKQIGAMINKVFIF